MISVSFEHNPNEINIKIIDSQLFIIISLKCINRQPLKY